MDHKERISSDPGVMLGKPVIKGTRITIELILKKLSEGATHDEILESYMLFHRKPDVLALRMNVNK